jgi:ATP-binding cassette subfamily C protein CydD
MADILAIKGVKGLIARLGALTILQSITIIVQSLFLAESISSLFRGDLFHAEIGPLAIFLASMLARKLVSFRKNIITFHFASKTTQSLKQELLHKLFQLGPRFVSKEGTGPTVALVLEGINQYRRYLELIFVKSLNALIIPPVVLLYIGWENLRSGFILLITLPIVIIFLILLGHAAKSKADRQFNSYRTLSGYFIDTIRGLETLRYLGISKRHLKSIATVSEQFRKATIATLKVAFLSSFALDFFTMLSIATVAVFLGMGLMNGALDLRPALTILILAPEFFLPIREMGADYHATLDGKNAGSKISEIFSLEINRDHSVALSRWNSKDSLSIRDLNVSFAEDERASLKGIDICVTGFEKIGIIGYSGAGKSTLINVLSGFIAPTGGEFLFNQQPFPSLSIANWQEQVTYIPQQPYLFHDTILNNLRFYRPDASKVEVEEIIERTGLRELIDSMPEGVDTVIGEGGRALSGGQEQRIAIARAFISNRPVLLLDEPTAHLDIETEAELKEILLDLFQEKLVFIATHRLHWMKEMDKIIVLDNGKIVESGSYQQLWNKDSRFYQLANMTGREG